MVTDPHRDIAPGLAFDGHQPELDPESWAASNATLIGRLSVAARASIWYGAIVRADSAAISIGRDSNIQDGCVVHADPGFPTIVREGVTVGHRAVLHGCTVEADSLVGMGAVVLNGATVGRGSLIAAGTVLLERTEVPPGSLVAGTPGKVRRELTEEEQNGIRVSARNYVELAQRHRKATAE